MYMRPGALGMIDTKKNLAQDRGVLEFMCGALLRGRDVVFLGKNPGRAALVEGLAALQQLLMTGNEPDLESVREMLAAKTPAIKQFITDMERRLAVIKTAGKRPDAVLFECAEHMKYRRALTDVMIVDIDFDWRMIRDVIIRQYGYQDAHELQLYARMNGSSKRLRIFQGAEAHGINGGARYADENGAIVLWKSCGKG